MPIETQSLGKFPTSAEDTLLTLKQECPAKCQHSICDSHGKTILVITAIIMITIIMILVIMIMIIKIIVTKYWKIVQNYTDLLTSKMVLMIATTAIVITVPKY